MLSVVIHPGWLLLLVCSVVLLLVGCTALPTRTPTQSPTAYPLVTLTTVPFVTDTPQPSSTQPASTTVPPIRLPDWLINRTVASQPPTGITATTPTCYTGPNQHVICLGQVWNQTEAALEHVTVRVILRGSDQQIIAEQVIALEQQLIPPQSQAPYRALIPITGNKDIQASARIVYYRMTENPPNPIIISGSRGVMAASDRYVITANLHNTGIQTIEHARLIITILDADNHVVGYRIHRIATAVAPHEERALRVEVIPQVSDSKLHHLLHVETWLPIQMIPTALSQ